MGEFKNTMNEIFNLIEFEEKRQNETINLIASENFVSENIKKCLASCLTNKYAEGYPSKRYYAGCEYVDQIEELAIQKAKELFHVEYVNVQPHSGTHANMIIYSALMKPGDKFLGLNLAMGGHLRHGSKASFSGNIYECIPYGLNSNDLIDYDQIEKLANENQPKLIVCGGSSYSREWNYRRLREICDKFNCYLVADISHTAGLIVGGHLENPNNYAHIMMTTTHKTLRGPRGAMIMVPIDFEINSKKISNLIQFHTFPFSSGGPHLNTIAAKAICFIEASTSEFKEYGFNVIKNSKAMASRFIEHGYNVVSNGTDNHLFIVCLENITGKHAQDLLEKEGIILNRNVIPNDKRSPFVTSGIRIGTAAITTKGWDEKMCIELVDRIDKILKN